MSAEDAASKAVESLAAAMPADWGRLQHGDGPEADRGQMQLSPVPSRVPSTQHSRGSPSPLSAASPGSPTAIILRREQLVKRQRVDEPEQGAGRSEDATMEEQRRVALGLRMRHLQMLHFQLTQTQVPYTPEVWGPVMEDGLRDQQQLADLLHRQQPGMLTLTVTAGQMAAAAGAAMSATDAGAAAVAAAARSAWPPTPPRSAEEACDQRSSGFVRDFCSANGLVAWGDHAELAGRVVAAYGAEAVALLDSHCAYAQFQKKTVGDASMTAL